MSLVISVFIPTGIIISGDSRTTGTIPKQVPNPQKPGQAVTVHTNIFVSDSTNKVFRVFNRFGIATFGNAHINQLPIAHHIDLFETQQIQLPHSTIELAAQLLVYFRQFEPIPATGFILAGYDQNEPFVLGVDVANNAIQRHNFNQHEEKLTYGAAWGGDSDIVARLLNSPDSMPMWEVMNIQDAMDFSRHLIRATIDQMRFEPRFQTVGGNIDTLLITNTSIEFIDLKKLSITN